MPNYTIRYLEAGMSRVESMSCDSDSDAIKHAKDHLRDADGVIEVWRAELVYHGTATAPIGAGQARYSGDSISSA